MQKLEELAFETIVNAIQSDAIEIRYETPLIGAGSILDSMKLVEVCLALEDVAEERGFEFDWTSESAMSTKRSIFRNVRSLVGHFCEQGTKE